jgi:hypothetical protein
LWDFINPEANPFISTEIIQHRIVEFIIIAGKLIPGITRSPFFIQVDVTIMTLGPCKGLYDLVNIVETQLQDIAHDFAKRFLDYPLISKNNFIKKILTHPIVNSYTLFYEMICLVFYYFYR